MLLVKTRQAHHADPYYGHTELPVVMVQLDSNGAILNDTMFRPNSSADYIAKASKVVTLVDLAGHERYFKTTAYGLTGHLPDYACLIVGANAGGCPPSGPHALRLYVPFYIPVCQRNHAWACATVWCMLFLSILLLAKPSYTAPELGPGCLLCICITATDSAMRILSFWHGLFSAAAQSGLLDAVSGKATCTWPAEPCQLHQTEKRPQKGHVSPVLVASSASLLSLRLQVCNRLPAYRLGNWTGH